MNKQISKPACLVPAAAAGQRRDPKLMPLCFSIGQMLLHSLITGHWILTPNQLFDPG